MYLFFCADEWIRRALVDDASKWGGFFAGMQEVETVRDYPKYRDVS
jgi:hypothetical protein